jgi:hypothetical protein
MGIFFFESLIFGLALFFFAATGREKNKERRAGGARPSFFIYR